MNNQYDFLSKSVEAIARRLNELRAEFETTKRFQENVNATVDGDIDGAIVQQNHFNGSFQESIETLNEILTKQYKINEQIISFLTSVDSRLKELELGGGIKCKCDEKSECIKCCDCQEHDDPPSENNTKGHDIEIGKWYMVCDGDEWDSKEAVAATCVKFDENGNPIFAWSQEEAENDETYTYDMWREIPEKYIGKLLYYPSYSTVGKPQTGKLYFVWDKNRKSGELAFHVKGNRFVCNRDGIVKDTPIEYKHYEEIRRNTIGKGNGTV